MDEEIFSLIEMLNMEDERHYRYVFDRIRQMGETAIEGILIAFQLAQMPLRLNLIFLMSDLREKAFLPTLIDTLRDNNPRIRTGAAYALGQLREKEAVPALCLALKDESLELRRNAAWALGEIRDPASVEALIDALSDVNPHVQEEAIIALGALQDQRAITPLKALIHRANAQNVYWVFRTLVLFGESILDFLIELLDSQYESIPAKSHAIWALGQLGNGRAIESLSKVLEDSEVKLVEAAVKALGQMNDLRVVPVLLPLLNNKLYNAEISKSFIRLGSAALELYLEALAQAQPSVRAQLALIIGEIHDKRAFNTLLALLNDADELVSRAGAGALGELGDKRAVKSLLALLSHEKGILREAAAMSLGKLKDNLALDALLLGLMDEEKNVRAAAAEALGKLREKKSVPLLVNALKDKEFMVRKNALVALGQIGDSWAVPAIVSVLKNSQRFTGSELSALAADALRKIGSTEALAALEAGEKRR